MSDLVPVTCYFTAESYRRLAKIAEKNGTQVHRLIERDVDRALNGGPRPPDAPRKYRQHYSEDMLEAIRHMHAAQMTDGAIAKKLGLSQANLSRRLRKMGLPAHGAKSGGRKKAEAAS
ncbi:hypothetical protein GCM10009775_04410 [Microbacterium aoyamense]|uniref:DNA binding HTH domain-containing protein n=1 Tax=Microbacterium aoyamense TaxID=344166 RepID=A0ABN2PC01_9MICO|nr:hypothetical protein [Microbacterium aoyamense]